MTGLFPYQIVIIIQIICVVHIIRANKSWWWLLGIWFFSDLACIIYFFIEVYPDIKRRRSRNPNPLQKLKSTKRRICELEEELEHVDTVEKKAELAHAYMTAKMFDDAIACYKDCLTGNYSDDTYLLFGLGETYFEAGRYDDSESTLQAIDATGSKDKKDSRDLLRARAFAEAGRVEDAMAQYEKTIMTFSGAEAKCRFAMFLQKNDDSQRAGELFREILTVAKRSTKFYRDANKEWIKVARKNG